MTSNSPNKLDFHLFADDANLFFAHKNTATIKKYWIKKYEIFTPVFV